MKLKQLIQELIKVCRRYMNQDVINDFCNSYSGMYLLMKLNATLDIYNNLQFEQEKKDYIKNYDFELDKIMEEIELED